MRAVPRRAAAGGLAAFLAGCATAPPSAPPPVRDGAPPRAAEGRTPPERGGSDGRAAAHERKPAPSAVPGPRPAEPRSAGLREAGPEAAPSRPSGGAPSPGTRREGVTAVVALLEGAREAEEAQQYGRAVAMLERALKVDPRDPRLWHRLAVVRYRQGRYEEAEALALRSSSLRPRDRALDARSWKVVAAARRAQGDEDGAREALRRAGSP